jgi:hypothetical protein
MHRVFVVLLAALALAACGQSETTYVIDGVPVVLELGEGPEQEHLQLAVGLYRQAAVEHWELEDGDRLVWRTLTAIRYRTGAVEGQALYHYGEATVYSNWYTCALDVPLYRAFARHYALEVEGLEAVEADETAHDAWAEELRDEHKPAVCTGGSPRRVINLPW